MALAVDNVRAQEVAGLDRAQVVEKLLKFDGRVPLGFTEEFLSRQSTEHLKHILLAAYEHLR